MTDKGNGASKGADKTVPPAGDTGAHGGDHHGPHFPDISKYVLRDPDEQAEAA